MGSRNHGWQLTPADVAEIDVQRQRRTGAEESDSDVERETSSSTNTFSAQEASESSTSGGSDKSSVVQSFTPSTPPATANSFRTGKRRKGVPHRSPFGSLMVEF